MIEQHQRDLLRWLEEIACALRGIREILTPRLSATLTIRGDNMATILVGKTANSVWQEFSGPNGTGDKLPPAGAIAFTSSKPAVATVDPSSGLVTAVAVGTATISGTDQANSLTASDTASVTETAVSA